MSVATNKIPPKFEDESDYETWKRDIEIWIKFTDLEKKKLASAIHLSLTRKAHVASSELTVDELCADDGVKTLMAKLDDIFLQDKSRRQFSSFRELYNLRRGDDVKIEDFVSEFEHIYYKFTKNGMTLPDSVVAFMLLASCNLDEKDVQIVMSAVADVKYDTMKNTIKRVFGSSIKTIPSANIKSEPTFEASETLYNNNNRWPRRGNNRGNLSQRGNFRGRGFGNNNKGRGGRKMNPIDKEGNVSRCHICDSKFHWAGNCPDAYENKKQVNCVMSDDGNHENNFEKEDVHLMLFIGYTNKEKGRKLDKLVSESSLSALLDSGCSKTVCGEKWFENYLSQLSDYDRNHIKEKNSSSSFTFGDGSGEPSLKRVEIPCYIGGKRSLIESDVVKSNIPLLLSKTSMKKGNMCLDFANDTLFVGADKIKLDCSSSGHYLLPLCL